MSSDDFREEVDITLDQKLYRVLKDIRNIILFGVVFGFIIAFLQFGGEDLIIGFVYEPIYYHDLVGNHQEEKVHQILAKATKDLCLFEPRFAYKHCEEVLTKSLQDDKFLAKDQVNICEKYGYQGITLDVVDCVTLTIDEYYEDEDGELPLDLNVKVQEHKIQLIPIKKLMEIERPDNTANRQTFIASCNEHGGDFIADQDICVIGHMDLNYGIHFKDWDIESDSWIWDSVLP